jgi:hypothetical protein
MGCGVVVAGCVFAGVDGCVAVEVGWVGVAASGGAVVGTGAGGGTEVTGGCGGIVD